jgi:hypothetical protein
LGIWTTICGGVGASRGLASARRSTPGAAFTLGRRGTPNSSNAMRAVSSLPSSHSMNSLDAFGRRVLARMAEGDRISTGPSLGASVATGLPLDACSAARLMGPADTEHSPEITVVTASMVERPTCALLAASFLKMPSP